MIKHLLLIVFSLIGCLAYANDSTYIARQSAYIDSTLNYNGGNKLSLQAFAGIPIDSAELSEILSDLPHRFNPDFDIVELIRVLFYADSLYDDDILPVLSNIPFWINNEDTIRNFWTENHMIMFMSSEWLLHERYGWSVDNTLYPRLKHYLELKKEYGFYEFYSSVYAPYTLSGLLNLYDFTEDAQLKELAKDVAQDLLIEMLRPTTDLGVFFPAAGRNYHEKYKTAYDQNHNSLIYLLTGFGKAPKQARHAGSFLATSNLPVDDVINSWAPKVNTTIHVGHPLANSATIHDSLTPIDRLIFEWSASAYAHPSIIERTFEVLRDSSMWQHKDWAAIRPLSAISPSSAPDLAETLNVMTYSSVISDYDVRIFKNHGVGLMSIANTWKGKIGFQQWPVAATVGTTAVYTSSGEVKPSWAQRDKNIENTHMPHVEQESNLALIMYRPEPIPNLLELAAGDQFEHKQVALFWQEAAYDEIIEMDAWLLGRQDNNYVAVRRSCTTQENGWWACDTETGQTWVIMVGDDEMYGSFSNFQDIIAAAQFSENWYYNFDEAEHIYQAQIIVDTFSLEYAWAIDTVPPTPTKLYLSPVFSVYPNPSKEDVTLSFNQNESIHVKVVNPVGLEIFSKKYDYDPVAPVKLKTNNWEEGVYFIIIESKGKSYKQKMIKL